MKNEFQRLMEQELSRLNGTVKRYVARRQELLFTKPRTTEAELEMQEIGLKLTKLNFARVQLRHAILAYKRFM